MNQESGEQEQSGQWESDSNEVTWGWKLFVGTLIAVLTFFWWLLIYSGGVVVQHS